MDVTDSSADDTQLYQDAWGNPMPDWTSGHWQTGTSRWGHNTKEIDGDTGLTYMYQRWYQSELGMFASEAPLPAFSEHEYEFGKASPTLYIDTNGLTPSLVDVLNGPKSCFPTRIRSWGRFVLGRWIQANSPKSEQNAMRHCLLMCILTLKCGEKTAAKLGLAHELEAYNYSSDQVEDFHNNQVGREHGKSACDGVDCYRKCRNSANEGTLALEGAATEIGLP